MTALIQGVSEKQKYSLSYDALWFQFFYIGSGFSCLLQKFLPPLPRLWYDTDKRNDADMPRHAAYLITKHRQNHSKGELCMIDFQNASLFKLRKDSRPKLDHIAPLLIPGEEVLGSYTTVRDYVVFTNKRVIAVNVQGMTGKKKDYTSMPYSKIVVYSIETSGVLDMDSELELYFSGVGKVTFEFMGSSDIVAIGQAISTYVLG